MKTFQKTFQKTFLALLVSGFLVAPVLSVHAADGIPASIAVKTFVPQSLRIDLKKLPKPNATESVSRNPTVVDTPPSWTLNAPEGFKISVIAKNLEGPRWLALTPDGDLLVTETSLNRILRIADRNGDGVPEDVSVFASDRNGLDSPFGMAFTNDAFFVGNTNALLRFSYTKGQAEITGKGQTLAKLPTGGHWTRDVAVSPDQNFVYVSIGSGSNVDAEEPPRASIVRMKPDGSNWEVFASGLRNPVSIIFRPGTEMLFTSVNERDDIGDDLVPDYVTHVEQGKFYGWPYAYLSPENIEPRRAKDGVSEKPDLAAKTMTPDTLVEAHAAVMQLAFPKPGMFPAHYMEGAFVTMRGSWNSSVAHGYKIAFLPFQKEKPSGSYEDFITGFVLDGTKPKVWGRPVGAIFLNDGSFVFVDEENGRLYRVTYGK